MTRAGAQPVRRRVCVRRERRPRRKAEGRGGRRRDRRRKDAGHRAAAGVPHERAGTARLFVCLFVCLVACVFVSFGFSSGRVQPRHAVLRERSRRQQEAAVCRAQRSTWRRCGWTRSRRRVHSLPPCYLSLVGARWSSRGPACVRRGLVVSPLVERVTGSGRSSVILTAPRRRKILLAVAAVARAR